MAKIRKNFYTVPMHEQHKNYNLVKYIQNTLNLT